MLPVFAEHLITVDLGDGKRDVFVTQSQSIPVQVTVICLHGWTLDHRSFVKQRALADRGVRLVRYDRRGFGHSGVAPNFQRELEDLDALVSYFDTPVVLYGVSQGVHGWPYGMRCLVSSRLLGLFFRVDTSMDWRWTSHRVKRFRLKPTEAARAGRIGAF